MDIMLAERVNEWTREWEAQGWIKGHAKGIQTGKRRVLQRLLEKKFGPLSDAHWQRLEAADEATLLEWSEKLLVAVSIDEIFR